MARARIGPLRGALLGLVARGPRSGYDLAKIFSATLANVWGTSHSQIYPELVAMEAEGLLATGEVGPRGRKPYVLTASGREALDRWLHQPPRRSSQRSEALLRMFFLGLLEPEEARAFLERERDYHRAQLDVYLEDLSSERPDVPAWWTGGLMLELGVRYEEMFLDWLERALDTIPSGARNSEHGTTRRRPAPSGAARRRQGTSRSAKRT